MGEGLARRVIQAAGPRISVAGSILDYGEFFVPDEALESRRGGFRAAAGTSGQSRESWPVLRRFLRRWKIFPPRRWRLGCTSSPRYAE